MKAEEQNIIFTMVKVMTEDGSIHSPAFTFTAKSQKEADTLAYKWKQYHGFRPRDAYARPAQGTELVWTIHNEYVN